MSQGSAARSDPFVSFITNVPVRRVARETVDAYRSTLTDHSVTVPKGTRFYDIPASVLAEGDRWGVHIQSNIVEIVRMAKGMRPTPLKDGRTTSGITFVFNRAGQLRIGQPES